MKVLCCILDNRFSGPHRLALTLARRLRDDGVETLFLFGHKTDEVWRPEGFESFLLRHIQCFNRHRLLSNFARFCWFLPRNLRQIRKIIRSNDIDIVHVDGITNFLPALAGGLTRTPIVWHYSDRLLRPLRWLLLPLAVALSTTVIVQGKGLQRRLAKAGTKLWDKTVVIYSGIDTATFHAARYDASARAGIRQELGLPVNGPVIGIVGNLNRHKGHAYFIQAAGRIKRRIADAKFLLVGRRLDTDRECWDQVQRLIAENGLESDVVYAGFRDDVPPMLCAMDVFVLASIWESCPVVLLEAMAMGVPVVTTDVGATSEMVTDGQTGFVVPPRDGAALAAAVLACLAKSEEEIQNMVAAARKRVEEEFAVDTIARQQLQVYRSANRRRVGHI